MVWRWRQDHGAAWPHKGIIHSAPSLPHGGGPGPCAANCVQEGQTRPLWLSLRSLHSFATSEAPCTFIQWTCCGSLTLECHFKKKRKGSLAFGTKEQGGGGICYQGIEQRWRLAHLWYHLYRQYTATYTLQLGIVSTVELPFEEELELK